MLGVAAAVVLLLVVSFALHRLLGSNEPVDQDAAASASASASAMDAKRAELIERVAAKRAELDRMVGHIVRIPGGSFPMGDDDGNLNERPRHEARTDAFELDELEVSVAAYQLCVGADRCTKPGTEPGCNWGRPDRRNHPVNCVDWTQADAFCRWAAKRLPTEAEWELAARGPNGARYPWGEKAPDDAICWRRGEGDGGPGEGTCPTSGSAADQSPYGVKGLGANVREWTATAFCPYSRPDCQSSTMVMRGGAWTDGDPLGVRSAIRNAKPQDYQSSSVGFRCARDVLARDD